MPIYCITTSCKKRGVYNFIGVSKEYYCGIHRQDGMVNIISKKCKTIGCNKIPSFNFEGLKPKYCVEHKEDEMIATDKRHCIYELCKIRANYKYPDGYIDESGIKIKSCWRVNKKGICLIEQSKIKEWQERLINLKSQIYYWICDENKSDKTIEIIQLYFDK